jgi:hypothetical protein
MTTGFFRAARSHAVALTLSILAVFGLSGRMLAQQAAASAAASPGAATAPDANARAALTTALSAVRSTGGPSSLPTADKFTFGDRSVGAGAEPGPVAVANGTLHVRGTINGDAIAWRGNVVVHEGGHITGNAWAIAGKVLIEGGAVDGDVRAFEGDLAATEAEAPPLIGAAAVWNEATLSLGWLVMLLTIGIGVLVFASSNLHAVGDGISRGFGRAFLAGIATQLALLPMMVLLVVALCLTVLGILLVPFAIVAYVLAAAGLVTLGYLAMAELLGQALTAQAGGDEKAQRAASLKGMLVGLVVLMAPWFAASALAWSPKWELVMRTIAVAVTWVAGTAGLGGAVISRGGVKRARTQPPKQAMATSWATPTPVAGVVAARRPTPYTTSGTK